MSLLDFYQQHGISPVRQDITDLPAHFQRRAALYRSLGLPPMAIKGRTVLEVGPGGGENALYTLSLKPSVYIAYEPNRVAADECRARVASYGPPMRAMVIEQALCMNSPVEVYDLVLCEGLLGLSGDHSSEKLEFLTQFVAPGGVLVITCIDAISDHAEVLRRAMAQRLLREHQLTQAPLADQVALLHPVFAPHLATLTGMTRSVDDWIVDNLLNPASIGPTFSIPDACAQLDGRFELLGCSPRFLVDWRWYKQQTPGLSWVVDAYWTQAHNLLDYRNVYPARPAARNRVLQANCAELRACQQAVEAGQLPPLDLSARPVDPGWFGRGQQYLSLVRTG